MALGSCSLALQARDLDPRTTTRFGLRRFTPQQSIKSLLAQPLRVLTRSRQNYKVRWTDGSQQDLIGSGATAQQPVDSSPHAMFAL